jgi:hypothetical protein
MLCKVLPLAALALAGGVAGTTSLLTESDGLYSATSERQTTLTTRGTRADLVSVGDDASAVSAQPRRGDRAELELVSVAMADPVADGVRRGTR